ncbi:MAG TPA: ABC transporter permease [Spirochaetales bacterium]|nr:ABC transporter permease [Spirochaetales bacterium]HRY53992.1 ABC transporter permease [Spirochaetia bacterium]HRZ63700.1 ABC transporter permease [Spirochaetia bacterium]
MSVKDGLAGLRDFWKEYSKVGSGKVGLGILAFFVVLAIVGPFVVPFPGATEHWQDITYWMDNPRAAPPAWVNLFRARKGAVSERVAAGAPSVAEAASGQRRAYPIAYEYRADKPPRDLIFRFKGRGKVALSLEVTRPDGSASELYRGQGELGEGFKRISVEHDAMGGVIALVNSVDEFVGSGLDPASNRPCALLFAEIDPDMADSPRPLKGEYAFTLGIELKSEGAAAEAPELLVSGEVSGILGTDVSKRDIFTGVVVGIKWALVIGFLTSIITVIAGVVFGVVAAYFGGAWDWALTRLYEFVYLLPVLPFLIVLSAIYKPSIYTFIVIVCLLFWTGPYKPVYSIALQIKEETFVEASKALGSGRMRIIFRHIVPILLPYSFAVMALSIPGVIVYEASVSLLGLGDSSIVTWGQILEAALSQGAMINNLWWWVIPPGLMIALMGMSFAFIGSAMDKILHPKLKTR